MPAFFVESWGVAIGHPGRSHRRHHDTHLEANLPPDEFWRFKLAFSAALERSGNAVDRALSLPTGHGLRLLIRSYALTRGLWQTLDFADRLRGDPRFEEHPLAGIDFDVELRTALAEYWSGALRDRP